MYLCVWFQRIVADVIDKKPLKCTLPPPPHPKVSKNMTY